jgi:thiamine-phosphate pyrophosphorylase
LLLITDRHQTDDLVATVRTAVANGCRWVSLREKDLPLADQQALLDQLRPLLCGVGGVMMVHGALDLARQCRGLHLPAAGDVVAARAALGPQALIGISCHHPGDLAAAAAAGADYATLSPIFPSASKPGYGPALGPTALADAPLPVLALGGVGPDNLVACLEAGAAGAALMGGPMRRPEQMDRLTAIWRGYRR